MSTLRTGTSSSYGPPAPGIQSDDRASVEGSSAGLVLLYSRNFSNLEPAYPFREGVIGIGRDATNGICIAENAVSRNHAQISAGDSGYTVRDLGSRNGTLLDGVRVSGDTELEHLHELRIGDALFKFVIDRAEHYVPYHLDGRVTSGRRAKFIHELVGGAQMDRIACELERIAPTQLSCVILGETGTGKEIAARALHRASARRGSFQAINCAAIPANLLESELFGYRKGAFSGADRDKPGLVKLAHGGTLFLDEIGDMPLDAQAKLLRVLQAREVFPLGATTPEHVDIRVVCATHRDVRRLVADERFRGDLFARLNEHMVILPPLRERKEDIYQLAHLFAKNYGRVDLEFSFSFMVALLHYDWPYNVRELESCMKRAVALAEGPVLDVPQLSASILEVMKQYDVRDSSSATSGSSGSQRPAPKREDSSRRPPPTDAELRDLLLKHRGNVAAVGRELGKERMQVHRWMKRYGISIDEYRDE